MRLLTNLLFEPKGMHNQNAAYNIKDTVMSGDGSRVYFAIQDVPAGIPLNDSNYWKLQIDLSGSKSAMEQALASFGNYAKEIGTRVKGETASASGNPVTFLPDAGSLLQPVTVLEPNQIGSGDPSPDNNRPFIGYNALGLTAAGKNLFDSSIITDSTQWVNKRITLSPNTTYIMSANIPDEASAIAGFYVYNSKGEASGALNKVYQSRPVVVTTLEDGIIEFQWITDAEHPLTAYQYQLELGSAPSSFAPYQGKLHTAQIGQTVYGGRMDWLTGKLVKAWPAAALRDLTISYKGGDHNYFEINMPSDALATADFLCESYKNVGVLYYSSMPTTPTGCMGYYPQDRVWRLKDTRYTSVDELLAGNGDMKIAYKLATPVEIQLAPHIISAAAPEQTNTLYGDGRIDVEYVKPLHVSIGGGSAPVQSVNGKTGDVQLTAADVGAASKDDVDKLSEEIAELKGEKKEPVTYVPDLAGYLKNDGTIVAYGTCFHTDYIPLDGYIRISAKAYLVATGFALAFFDSNKTLLKDLSIAGLGGTGKPNIIDMDVPNGVAYCMLSNFYGSDNTNTDTFITLYPEMEETANSPLTGVTINVLGDSISSDDYVTPNYWQLIAEKTGCVFNDYAVSATRIATVAADNKESFLTRAARMDTSADAVLVMGGTNDCNLHTLLGEWDSEDESTFYGALNALITLLRTNFSGKPIIFCTPIKRKYDTDSGFPDTMADLKAASATEQITMQHCVLAIKAKCARHGIPVIDLADQSGFSPLTPEYYRADDDNLHPSALGFMRIANMVQPELEKQFAYKPD